jgi:hypothetical protein
MSKFQEAVDEAMAQEVLDRTWQYHIVEEHPLGQGAEDAVYYALENGVELIDAIGCQLDKDEARSLESEAPGMGIDTILKNDISRVIQDPKVRQRFAEWEPIIPFLYALQLRHDYCFTQEEYRKSLIDLAKRWELNIPTDEQLSLYE